MRHFALTIAAITLLAAEAQAQFHSAVPSSGLGTRPSLRTLPSISGYSAVAASPSGAAAVDSCAYPSRWGLSIYQPYRAPLGGQYGRPSYECPLPRYDWSDRRRFW